MQKAIKNFFENEIILETIPWICLGYYILYHLILNIYGTSEGIDTFVVDILSGISVVTSSVAYKKKNRDRAISMLCVVVSALAFMEIDIVISKILRKGLIDLLRNIRAILHMVAKVAVFYSFVNLSLNVPRNLKYIKMNQISIVVVAIVDLSWSIFIHTVEDFPIYHTIPCKIAFLAECFSIVALELKLGLYSHKE